MRYRGIHYDAGVQFSPKRLTRVDFDEDLVRRELETIAGSLHANAVRIVGEDPARLAYAARTSIDLGLAVYLSPWLVDRGEAELGPYLVGCAAIAEQLRRSGGDVTLVVGCELSLFMHGVLPGETVYERIEWLRSRRDGDQSGPATAAIGASLGEALTRLVPLVRESFGGPVTYASGQWEIVPWELFDIVAVDLYRSGQSDDGYRRRLRSSMRPGKPFVITEIGCCTYVGADLKGGLGWDGVDEWRDGGPAWLLAEPPARSEATQAAYLLEQLDVFASENVDGVFVYTLVAPYLPTHTDPWLDFDMSSFALAKTLPAAQEGELPWRPKEAFHAVAGFYERLARGG
ncbi:MAG TPA: hypothetical protein VMD59_20205 [Acidimicrobiales bacterium]|nr:hypothetical protein [Acidimicrobiales bacterium]